MINLDQASFKRAQTNGTGFYVGMCPDEVLVYFSNLRMFFK